MKKIITFALIIVLGVAVSSCDILDAGDDDDEFTVRAGLDRYLPLSEGNEYVYTVSDGNQHNTVEKSVGPQKSINANDYWRMIDVTNADTTYIRTPGNALIRYFESEPWEINIAKLAFGEIIIAQFLQEPGWADTIYSSEYQVPYGDGMAVMDVLYESELVGYESVTVPAGDHDEVAHYKTTMNVTVHEAVLGGTGELVASKLTTTHRYFAVDVGLIKTTKNIVDEANNESSYSEELVYWSLSDGTHGGEDPR
jgi:hypothetical protein